MEKQTISKQRIADHGEVFTSQREVPNEGNKRSQLDLFSANEHVSDLGEKVFLPTETHSYPPVHFLKIGEVIMEEQPA